MAAGKKESILDLTKFLDKQITVKFNGGREVRGTLKAYDQLVNLTLDDCEEFLRDPDDPYKLTGATRPLGLVVCRGNNVMLVSFLFILLVFWVNTLTQCSFSACRNYKNN
eukprot:Phypoly_transcript_27442.p1 GENE.Phypoly_transcript_27442~~Phypoly_transcript_27442.p1  ORF type:complete len:110 (-),score=7.07 Phypoly_transcript_27442:126-455(-)